MGWDVELKHEDGDLCEVEPHNYGSVYPVGGTDLAEVAITYNYGQYFRNAWPEPIEGSGALRRMLDGRRAEETIPLLQAAVLKLGTERSSSYWDATAGNAGYALSLLLSWALVYPDAIWEVT